MKKISIIFIVLIAILSSTIMTFATTQISIIPLDKESSPYATNLIGRKQDVAIGETVVWQVRGIFPENLNAIVQIEMYRVEAQKYMQTVYINGHRVKTAVEVTSQPYAYIYPDISLRIHRLLNQEQQGKKYMGLEVIFYNSYGTFLNSGNYETFDYTIYLQSPTDTYTINNSNKVLEFTNSSEFDMSYRFKSLGSMSRIQHSIKQGSSEYVNTFIDLTSEEQVLNLLPNQSVRITYVSGDDVEVVVDRVGEGGQVSGDDVVNIISPSNNSKTTYPYTTMIIELDYSRLNGPTKHKLTRNNNLSFDPEVLGVEVENTSTLTRIKKKIQLNQLLLVAGQNNNFKYEIINMFGGVIGSANVNVLHQDFVPSPNNPNIDANTGEQKYEGSIQPIGQEPSNIWEAIGSGQQNIGVDAGNLLALPFNAMNTLFTSTSGMVSFVTQSLSFLPAEWVALGTVAIGLSIFLMILGRK